MPTNSTINVVDSAGSAKPLRVIDISGTGSGPFLTVHTLADGSGAAISAANPLPISSESSDPSEDVRALTFSMISDSVDLPVAPRAMRIFNGKTTALTLMVHADPAHDAFAIKVPAGVAIYEPIKVTRILSTGSVGLISSGALDADVSILLLL